MPKHRLAAFAIAALVVLPAASEAASITATTTTVNLVEGPVTYGFLFGTPVTPDFYTQATLEGELVVTPVGQGSASVTVGAIYPTYLSGYGLVAGSPTNLGVDLGTTTCAASGIATTCTFSLVTNTFPPTFYDGLELLITYGQTGVGSTASWDATLTLTQVPEPATWLLFGAAVTAGLRARTRARRRE